MRRTLTLILFLALAAPARAGTYEHYTISAVSPGLDGWSPYVQAPGGFVATSAVAGALSARFWARPAFAPGDIAQWTYTAPPDTTVANWDMERMVTGIGGGDWNTLFAAMIDGTARFVSHDVPSRNQPWALVRAGGLGASRLVAVLRCGGPHTCVAAGTALLALRNSRVILYDAYAPAVGQVQGDLMRDDRLAGTAKLSLTATDRGAGLYRAFVEVDGRLGAPVAIGDTRCRDLIPGGSPYQFAYRQPCPLSAGATVALDTTSLPDGRHAIAVVLEDAAGNRVTAYGPVTRTVDNVPDLPPLPIPTLTPTPAPRPAAPPQHVNVVAWLAHHGHRTLAATTAYDERVRLTGRVTDTAGRPVAGAAVDLAERVTAPHHFWREMTGLRTRADGRFTVFTRVGPSRQLRISAPGAGAPVLTVYVRAPVVVRRHGAIVRGRLRGGYVPRGGALIELQTRARARWVTRRVVRTWSTGRFSARLTGGRVRAVVPRQPGLPYVAGRAITVSARRTGARTGPRTSR